MTDLIHGNYVNFLMKKCRCDLCRDANRREQKRFRIYGARNAMVDATRTQTHIRALQDVGMPFNAIAKAAGYSSRNALVSILESRRVRVTTEARILAISLASDTRPMSYVDALGTRRRLQALAALGYSIRDIAARISADDSDIQRIQAGTQQVVRAHRAQAVAELFDSLSMTPGTSARAAKHAQSKHWAPPLAWDEGMIDDPAAKPDGVTVGRQRLDIRDLYELREMGLNDAEIASRLGVNLRSIQRWAAREQVAA